MTSDPADPPDRDPSAPTVLLITSNGAGMGHLTRMLAVALGSNDSDRFTVMSMSVALPVVVEQGIRAEYCPSVERGWFTGPRWHAYLAERVVALAEEVGADLIAFDGVAPYRGIALAAERLPDVAFVWMRRGLWRAGANLRQLEASAWFDAVIEPGDLAAAADRGGTAGRTDATVISPVSLLDVIEPLPRDEARAALGLDGDGPTLLLTLGSGRLGEVAAPGQVVLDAAVGQQGWQVAMTRSAIATKDIPADAQGRVTLLDGIYPLVRYLNAFDAVVSAAGYNAVHEFVSAGVPTLLVANPATRTDDQVGRAEHLGAAGLALATAPDADRDLAAAVRDLLTGATRDRLAAAVAELEPGRRGGGAQEANRVFADVIAQFRAARAQGRNTRVGVTVSATPTRRLRATARSLLGRRGSNVIRRALGKQLEPAPLPPLPVDFVDPSDEQANLAADTPASGGQDGAQPQRRTVVIGGQIPAELIRSGPPVEHLVTGADARYARRRRDIARSFYEHR